MNKINVISKKYDGTPRDEAETFMISHTGDVIVLLSLPDEPVFVHKRNRWESAPDGLLQLYFMDRWYNVWHIADQRSGFNKIYANIAMPPTFVNNTLTWVDLDLDIRVHMDGSVELLDEDEFLAHQRTMDYPQELVAQARAAAEEGVQLATHGLYPFDYEIQVANYRRLIAESGITGRG